jgi:hypothetical protein
VVKTVVPKAIIPVPALGLARRMGNGPGDLIEQGDNVDGQAAALFWPAGFPFEEIETPFSGTIDDNEIIFSAYVGCPLLPLAALLLLGAKHQAAESGSKVAVGKVLGWSAGFSTAGCTENCHSGLRVRKTKSLSVAPIPKHGLRVEIW